MPTRTNAVATCSCGAKWGDRGGIEDNDAEIAGVARALLRAAIPKMFRHWALGHRIAGHGPHVLFFRTEIRKLLDHTAKEATP